MQNKIVHYWIKSACGRQKYTELAAKKGGFAWIRLGWFVFFAALRDLKLNNPDQSELSDS